MNHEALKKATDKGLLDALSAGAKKGRTSQEAAEQKISFIYSAMDKDSGVTKERIREELQQAQ